MEPRAGGAMDPRGNRGVPFRQVVNKAGLVPEQRRRRRRRRAVAQAPYPHPHLRQLPGLSGVSGEMCRRALPGVTGDAWALTVSGRRPPPRAGPRAWRRLARLDARPLAARAAADLAALVRKAGATLRLLPKDADSELDSADIEVTDSRLPNPTFLEHRNQLPQASDRFCVELVRGSAGFGLTLSGGRDAAGDAPLAVRRLLKDGPAQRCGRLQAGDLVLHINGESTQGLTHAQVVERIRTSGPRLCLVLSRPLETHPDRSPDSGGPEVMRSHSASASPLQHPQSCTTPKTGGSPTPSPEGAADGPAVPPLERRTEDPDHRTPGSPGPWLVPSEERLSRALGVPGAAHLALDMAAGRRRH